jgi:hypothetical protein
VTHEPAAPGDPPLDRLVELSWTFDANGQAVPTVGPYEDTVFGRSHMITYYPHVRLDQTAGTITIDRLEGSEDGSPNIDVTYQLDRIGEAVAVKPGRPPSC